MARRPELNLVAERYRFHRRQQHPQESVDDYISALRSLVVSCDYGPMWQEMIRDQLVEKTRNPLTRKLLLDVPNITLESAVELARSTENQAEQADNLRLDSGRQNALRNHNVPIPSPDHSGRAVDMLQKPASDKERPTTQTQLNARRLQYHKVQRFLNDQIHPRSPLFGQLRLAAGIYLEPAAVVECQQPSDILDALCAKRLDSVENYKCLCEILKQAKLYSVMRGVELIQNRNSSANTAHYEDTKRDCTRCDVKPDLPTGATVADEHPGQQEQRLSGSRGRSQIQIPVSAKRTRQSTVEDKPIMKSTFEPVISSPSAQRELNYANDEDTLRDCTSSDVKPYLPTGATADDEHTRQQAQATRMPAAKRRKASTSAGMVPATRPPSRRIQARAKTAAQPPAAESSTPPPPPPCTHCPSAAQVAEEVLRLLDTRKSLEPPAPVVEPAPGPSTSSVTPPCPSLVEPTPSSSPFANDEDTFRDCTSSDVKPYLPTGATADDEHTRQRAQTMPAVVSCLPRRRFHSRPSGSRRRSQIPIPDSVKLTRRSTVEDKLFRKVTSAPAISSSPSLRGLNYANDEDTLRDCTSSNVKPYLPTGATADDEHTRQRAQAMPAVVNCLPRRRFHSSPSNSRGRSQIPIPDSAKLTRRSTVEDKLVTSAPAISSSSSLRGLNYGTFVMELLVKICGKLDHIAEVLTRGEEQYESIGIQESREIVTLEGHPPGQLEATVTETVEYQTPTQPDPEYHCAANCSSPFLDINDNDKTSGGPLDSTAEWRLGSALLEHRMIGQLCLLE